MTRYERPDILAALAAAYAEAGRFVEARDWARRAIDRATRSGQQALVDQLRRHLRFYELSRAFHESP